MAQMGGITIVGLGPGDGRLLTRQAWEILSSAEAVYLRTSRHPAVEDLPSSVQRHSFDHLYEAANDFAQVYESIASEILRLGRQEQGVIYAVPGHPYVGEATVTRIKAGAAAEGIPVTIVPGLSFIEPSLTALGLDALDGLQLFDAIEVASTNYPPVSPDVPLLLGQLYSRQLANDVKLSLMAVYPDEHPVTLVHQASTGSQFLETIPLYAMDRSEHIAHLTSLYVPPLPYGSTLPALADTVATLRGPGGCPWDQEQTPQSIRPDLQEEAAEVLGAIDTDDPAALREELGDLLFHIVIQAQMATEAGDFKLADVIGGVNAKLIRRHPHVWSNWQVSNSADVIRNWELLKQQEAAGGEKVASLLDNIPVSLPALARAQKIQRRVKKVGFDWPSVEGVAAKVAEEIRELNQAVSAEEKAAEVGDLLFAVVNWARWLGVDAETALRESNLRFSRRFRQLERLANERQLDLTGLSLEALDELWLDVKEQEKVEAGGKPRTGSEEKA